MKPNILPIYPPVIFFSFVVGTGTYLGPVESVELVELHENNPRVVPPASGGPGSVVFPQLPFKYLFRFDSLLIFESNLFKKRYPYIVIPGIYQSLWFSTSPMACAPLKYLKQKTLHQ